jgi:hypothetical protein
VWGLAATEDELRVVPDGGNGSLVGLLEKDLEVGEDYLVPDRTGWARQRS